MKDNTKDELEHSTLFSTILPCLEMMAQKMQKFTEQNIETIKSLEKKTDLEENKIDELIRLCESLDRLINFANSNKGKNSPSYPFELLKNKINEEYKMLQKLADKFEYAHFKIELLASKISKCNTLKEAVYYLKKAKSECLDLYVKVNENSRKYKSIILRHIKYELFIEQAENTILRIKNLSQLNQKK
ncbi:hypothetical protein EDEG_00819 [Edhazardia aedis USNM 41457]|uniref:Uncharacterized protein n=1 Tax=Edhazardia aedis (strain USNM 41457) TaxID=1003232 RepID=J8ZZE1_EDHAE|nr:hypothetical protein EDEG_00819 [Edhazardia aedis USNM 41457]|eukprot:EJW05038.1 hypothetical protein EDEG_00819 [Edhazardia aedis USNM 41457]